MVDCTQLTAIVVIVLVWTSIIVDFDDGHIHTLICVLNLVLLLQIVLNAIWTGKIRDQADFCHFHDEVWCYGNE